MKVMIAQLSKLYVFRVSPSDRIQFISKNITVFIPTVSNIRAPNHPTASNISAPEIYSGQKKLINICSLHKCIMIEIRLAKQLKLAIIIIRKTSFICVYHASINAAVSTVSQFC